MSIAISGNNRQTHSVFRKKRVALIMLIIALQFDVSSKKKKETSSFNHADHSFDELKLIINFRLLWLHSGHVVVCTAILPLP